MKVGTHRLDYKFYVHILYQKAKSNFSRFSMHDNPSAVIMSIERFNKIHMVPWSQSFSFVYLKDRN